MTNKRSLFALLSTGARGFVLISVTANRDGASITCSSAQNIQIAHLINEKQGLPDSLFAQLRLYPSMRSSGAKVLGKDPSFVASPRRCSMHIAKVEFVWPKDTPQ